MHLKTGTHNYSGNIINLTPIRTQLATCYKLESLSIFESITIGIIKISSADYLEKVHLLIAAENTWQGIVYGNWAKTKPPLKVVGKFSSSSSNAYFIQLQDHVWTHLQGVGNYSRCIDENISSKNECVSIFHPYSYIYDERYQFNKISNQI